MPHDVAAVALNAPRMVASCLLRRGYPGVFPNNTALPGPSDRAIRTNTCLSGTAHKADDGRKRAPPLCANPCRTIGPGPDDRNAASPLALRAYPPPTPPPHRPLYGLSPYAVVVILDGRPPVVNTCSVREHASYVISAPQINLFLLFIIVCFRFFLPLFGKCFSSLTIFFSLVHSDLTRSFIINIFIIQLMIA